MIGAATTIEELLSFRPPVGLANCCAELATRRWSTGNRNWLAIGLLVEAAAAGAAEAALRQPPAPLGDAPPDSWFETVCLRGALELLEEAR